MGAQRVLGGALVDGQRAFALDMPFVQVLCFAWYFSLRAFHPDSDAPLMLRLSAYCGDEQMVDDAKNLCFYSLHVDKPQLVSRILSMYQQFQVLSNEGLKAVARWIKGNGKELKANGLWGKLHLWPIVYNAVHN